MRNTCVLPKYLAFHVDNIDITCFPLRNQSTVMLWMHSAADSVTLGRHTSPPGHNGHFTLKTADHSEM